LLLLARFYLFILTRNVGGLWADYHQTVTHAKFADSSFDPTYVNLLKRPYFSVYDI